MAAITAAGIGVRATYGAQVSGDEPQYLLSALSLWEDADLDISDEVEEERYRSFHEADLPEQTIVLHDGTRKSPHDPLLPLLLALPMGIGGWIGAKAALAIMGGALAALTVWTAHQRFAISPGPAFATVAVFALAPPLAVYSTQVYPEIPAALALLAGLAATLGPFATRARIVFAVAVIALPWLAVKYVPVAAALALCGLIRAGKDRRAGLIGIFLAAGVAYLLGHLALYGGLTAYAAGDHFVGGEITAVGHRVDLWGRSTRLIGLLVDRFFGIGGWQPAYLLLPLVVAGAIKRRSRGDVPVLAVLGTGWLVAAFVALTMHGWWFPGRQLVVVLPLAVLLIAAWVDRGSSARVAVFLPAAALGLVSFGFFLAEGLKGQLTWVVDFGATANPFYGALAPFLPDYAAPIADTWLLHGLWVVAVAAMAALGWQWPAMVRHRLETAPDGSSSGPPGTTSAARQVHPIGSESRPTEETSP